MTNHDLSEALSPNLLPLYTQTYISPYTSTTVTTMLNNVINELYLNMDAVTWLDQVTRDAAKGKAKAFSLNIGGPKEWELPEVELEKEFIDSYIEVQNVSSIAFSFNFIVTTIVVIIIIISMFTNLAYFLLN